MYIPVYLTIISSHQAVSYNAYGFIYSKFVCIDKFDIKNKII